MSVLSLVLILLLMFIFFVLSCKFSLDYEGVSSYECGFDIISKTRLYFSYRFFLLSILFLVFDVEIILMVFLPYFSLSYFCVVLFFVFLLVIAGGLLYEFSCGVLSWLNIVSKA